jgi:hypothetical protein
MNVKVESDGEDLFIIVDGVKIAKRGHPNTPQARTWISLEPGWEVRGWGSRGVEGIEILHQDVRVH